MVAAGTLKTGFNGTLAAACALGLILFPAPLLAQSAGKKPEAASQAATSGPVTLDSLFTRLAKSQDAAESKGIGDQIIRLWSRSGSDTADLLMARVNISIKAENYELALDLLDSVVTLEPQWAEAYNRRATVLYLKEDLDGAMRDIRQTLYLEPRHFGAIAGMSLIFQATDDKKRALKAARAALAIYPFMEGAEGYVERHAREVDGENL